MRPLTEEEKEEMRELTKEGKHSCLVVEYVLLEYFGYPKTYDFVNSYRKHSGANELVGGFSKEHFWRWYTDKRRIKIRLKKLEAWFKYLEHTYGTGEDEVWTSHA
jgi:hypothetical protein